MEIEKTVGKLRLTMFDKSNSLATHSDQEKKKRCVDTEYRSSKKVDETFTDVQKLREVIWVVNADNPTGVSESHSSKRQLASQNEDRNIYSPFCEIWTKIKSEKIVCTLQKSLLKWINTEFWLLCAYS